MSSRSLSILSVRDRRSQVTERVITGKKDRMTVQREAAEALQQSKDDELRYIFVPKCTNAVKYVFSCTHTRTHTYTRKHMHTHTHTYTHTHHTFIYTYVNTQTHGTACDVITNETGKRLSEKGHYEQCCSRQMACIHADLAGRGWALSSFGRTL